MKKFLAIFVTFSIFCLLVCGVYAEEDVIAPSVDDPMNDIQDSVINLDDLVIDDEYSLPGMDEVNLEDLLYNEEADSIDNNMEEEVYSLEDTNIVPDEIPMADGIYSMTGPISNSEVPESMRYNGTWLWPLDKKQSDCYIDSTWGICGDRNISNGSKQHHGVDINPVTTSNSACASRAGTAYTYKNQGPRGNAVVIDHGDGYYTVYQHLSQISVPNGSYVAAKQEVGKCGVTGLDPSNGVHLHFEILFCASGAGHQSEFDYTWGGDYRWGINIWCVVNPQSVTYIDNEEELNITNLYFKDVVYPQTFKIDTKYGWNLSGGTLASNYDLTSIKSLIVDSNGNTVSSGSQSISGKYYSVRGLDTFSSSDNGVKFSYIGAEGSYKWILIATDSNGRTLRLVMPFTAVSGGSTSTTTAGKEYADYYKVKSENVTYKVIKDVTARKKPFDDAEKGSKFTKGKKVVSVAIVMNKYNNLWIQTNDNQYIYSGYHVEENDTVTQKGNQYFEVDNGGSSPTWAASLASIFGILNVNAKTTDDTPQDDTSHGGDGRSFDDSGSQQSEQWTYQVTTPDGLNMRDSAGTSGALVTTLWSPTTVTVTKKQSADGYTWGYGTSSNGYTGWIVVDNNWTTLVSANSPAQTHTHTPVTDAAVPATCTEAGKTEGSHCSTCGEVLTAQQTIPATGHKATTVKGTAATCTQTGLTDGSKCSVCGAVLVAQETIPATEHKATTVKGTAATCTQTGLTDGSKCSVCGTILTAQKTIPATGHTPVADPAVAATCTTEGKTEGSHCAVCGAIIVAQQVIPATGHTPVVDPAVAPAYGVEGRTEGSHCAVCGAVLVAQQPIPALTYQELALGKVKNNGTITLAVGEQRLIVPAFATAAGWTVNGYQSNKPAVASIDGNGLLTANAEGKAKITVTTNEKKKATLTVKVVDPYKPTAIAIAQGKAVTIAMGQPLQLNAVLAPESARATLAWASNKPKVATVDGNGLVTPVGEGKAKITVRTQNKKKATIAVQVVDPNKPLGIAIAQGKSITLKVGESVQLGVGLNPATAQSALTWKTNKPAIANVDANGVVTALKKGKAKITVMTYNKKKATIAVNVVE